MQGTILPLLGLLTAAPVAAVAQTVDPAPPGCRHGPRGGQARKDDRAREGIDGLRGSLCQGEPRGELARSHPLSGETAPSFLRRPPVVRRRETNLIKLEAALAQSAALKAEMDHLDGQSGDMKSSSRSAWFVYRPALSYHAPKMGDVAKSRLVSVTTYRAAGPHPGLNDYMKVLNAA